MKTSSKKKKKKANIDLILKVEMYSSKADSAKIKFRCRQDGCAKVQAVIIVTQYVKYGYRYLPTYLPKLSHLTYEHISWSID